MKLNFYFKKSYVLILFLGLLICNSTATSQIFKLKADINITSVNLTDFNNVTEQNKWERVDDNSLDPPTAADFTDPNALFVIDHQVDMQQINVTCNNPMMTAGLVLEPFNKTINFTSNTGVNFNHFEVGGTGTGQISANIVSGNSTFNELLTSNTSTIGFFGASITINNILSQQGSILINHSKITISNGAQYQFSGGSLTFPHDDDPDECIAGIGSASFISSDFNTTKDIRLTRQNGIENGPGNLFQFDNVANVQLPDMTLRGRYFYNGLGNETTGTLIPNNIESLSTTGMNENANITLTLSKDIATDSLALGASIVLGNRNLSVINTSIGNIWPFSTGQDANFPGRKIVTDGTGTMTFSFFTGEAVFPVAHTTNLGSNYMPLKINNTVGPFEGFSVRAANNVSFPYDQVQFKAVTTTWDINEQTPGGNTAVLTFQWDLNELEPGFMLNNNVRAARFNGNVNLVDGIAVNPDNVCVTFTTVPVNQFSPWTVLSSGQPLPIQLINFDAILQANKVKLNWSTASENNNDHFDIERSVDGVNFIKIGEVKGQGNSVIKVDYNFVDDAKLLNGEVLYRLKQVDFDANFTYSSVKSVNIKKEEKMLLSVAPNPFVHQVILNVNSDKNKELKVRIINNNGQSVFNGKYDLKKGTTELKINELSSLPKGIYTVELLDVPENKREVYKLIK